MDELNKEETLEIIKELQYYRDNQRFSNNKELINNTNSIIKLRKYLKHLEDKEVQNDKNR